MPCREIPLVDESVCACTRVSVCVRARANISVGVRAHGCACMPHYVCGWAPDSLRTGMTVIWSMKGGDMLRPEMRPVKVRVTVLTTGVNRMGPTCIKGVGGGGDMVGSGQNTGEVPLVNCRQQCCRSAQWDTTGTEAHETLLEFRNPTSGADTALRSGHKSQAPMRWAQQVGAPG